MGGKKNDKRLLSMNTDISQPEFGCTIGNFGFLARGVLYKQLLKSMFLVKKMHGALSH